MAYNKKDLNAQVRGDDWTLKFTISSEGSVLDITGYTYTFTLKSNIDDVDPGDLQVIIVASGLDATNGIVYINAAAADTNTLNPKTYNYDVQQVDTTGSVQTLVIGKVKVEPDVTRSI